MHIQGIHPDSYLNNGIHFVKSKTMKKLNFLVAIILLLNSLSLLGLGLFERAFTELEGQTLLVIKQMKDYTNFVLSNELIKVE